MATGSTINPSNEDLVVRKARLDFVAKPASVKHQLAMSSTHQAAAEPKENADRRIRPARINQYAARKSVV